MSGHRLANGHKIGNFQDTFGGKESSEQDVGIGQVELLVERVAEFGRDLEGAAALTVQKRSKNRRRIESGKTEKINRTVQGHERDCIEITDNSMVFYGLRKHGVPLTFVGVRAAFGAHRFCSNRDRLGPLASKRKTPANLGDDGGWRTIDVHGDRFARFFQCFKLARQEIRIKEMSGAIFEAFAKERVVTLEIDELQTRLSQVVAVRAAERGTGDNALFLVREDFGNQAANRIEPRAAIGVCEGNPGMHLPPVRAGMEIVTFVESTAYGTRELSPNSGFA
jgi:hypothetical protein